MDKPGVTRETEVVVAASQSVQGSVIDALPSQCVDRLAIVAGLPQRAHQFAREVLVDENPHAAFSSANSVNAPRTASSERLG